MKIWKKTTIALLISSIIVPIGAAQRSAGAEDMSSNSHSANLQEMNMKILALMLVKALKLE